MNDNMKIKKNYIGYEYKEVVTNRERVSMYLDGYENFGWEMDDRIEPAKAGDKLTIKMRRDRKIINRVELTRLQRNFEACMEEIEVLEKSCDNVAIISSIMVGLIGTAFMAMSTFAVTADPPIIWLCIILAIPGFAGWILPCIIYKRILYNRRKKIAPYIEEKQDEIYELCEKGNGLLIK